MQTVEKIILKCFLKLTAEKQFESLGKSSELASTICHVVREIVKVAEDDENAISETKEDKR